MKVRYVAIASVLAGAVLGVGLTWADFHEAPSLLLPLPSDRLTVDGQDLLPKALVDSESFNFGAVDQGSTVRHAFKITNIGKGLLKLKAAGTTCTRCTIAELTKSEVPPGQTTEVVVEYSATAGKPTFTQIATVRTNDPNHDSIELTIGGKIVSKVRYIPELLSFSTITAGSVATSELKIYSYLTDKISVVSHNFTEAQTAKYFAASVEPIPANELKEPDAKGGCRLVVTIKPGLPLGPLHQTIVVKLQVGDDPELTSTAIPIEGMVDSDIAIVGANWSKSTATLTIGNVRSSEGASRKLMLLVRGEARNNVQFDLQSSVPNGLKVTLGQPTELNSSVTQIPLTVEIPPGMPPGIHLGTEQGRAGEIVLGVKNHPVVQSIPLFVKFLVEK